MSIEDVESRATFVCLHVFERQRAVKLAYREGGMLCFLCGESDHANEHEDFRIVGLGHLLSDDPSLEQIVELPEGGEIVREGRGARWTLAE